jgi:hypothetical protein
LGDEVVIAVDDKLACSNRIGRENGVECDDLKLLKASAPTSASHQGSHNGRQSNSLFAAISVAVGAMLFAFAKRLLIC